jgi:outer membrane lipoprotein-sorting protein
MIRRYSFVALLLLVIPTTGCLFRSHKVENHLSSAILHSATQQELIDRIDQAAAAIKTMNATVDIRAAVGGQKKGKVTEYTEIRGYILAEKPSMLRMIGLVPVVRNRAFDMASDGANFKLSIPPKNRFIVGRNDIATPNPNQPLENLRPQHIYDALLLRAIDPKQEVAVIESAMQPVADPKTHKPVEQPNYVITVVRREGSEWHLSRKIYFDRTDLTLYRQVLYDNKGDVATTADYSDLKVFNGIAFPTRIEIVRPQEEYDIGLNFIDVKINQPLRPDQFELQQPPGAVVVHLTNGDNATTANQK